MQPEARSGPMNGAATHPLAELLACPPAVGSLLNGSAQCIDFDAGDTIFRQGEAGRGLYVVVSGQLQRRAERMDTRITLGSARAGELVELAAALGDGVHTYTLRAQTTGSLLLLPIEALRLAFKTYPPLRMQLLEELAREVSRAYHACCVTRAVGIRRHGNCAPPA
ncbi:MAG: Crp/Fnr family transcriptional regulator [Terracidiphilus sp.]